MLPVGFSSHCQSYVRLISPESVTTSNPQTFQNILPLGFSNDCQSYVMQMLSESVTTVPATHRLFRIFCLLVFPVTASHKVNIRLIPPESVTTSNPQSFWNMLTLGISSDGQSCIKIMWSEKCDHKKPRLFRIFCL